MVLKQYQHPTLSGSAPIYCEVESKKEFFACKLFAEATHTPGFKRLSQEMNGNDMHILAEFDNGDVWLLSVVREPLDQKTIHRWLPARA